MYYGVYDGWTGLVKHPYKGAKEGPVGFIKGIGKGIGGFVLKDLSAVFGPIGFTLKGIHKEIVKGRQPTAFIMEARMMQGARDFRELDDQRREQALQAVEMGWRTILDVRHEVEEKKSHGIGGRIALHKERKRWQKHGVFESVEQTGRALQAEKRGESLEEVFDQHRRELKKSSGLRKSTMANVHGSSMKELEQQETAVNGDMGERNGTVIAGGHTSPKCADRASELVPHTARALVHGNKTLTGRLSRLFHKQEMCPHRRHGNTAAGHLAKGGRLELSNDYTDNYGQDQWFQPDATEPDLWMAQMPEKNRPSIRKRSSSRNSGYEFQHFAPHSPVSNRVMYPGDALKPAPRQSFKVGDVEPVADLETNPDINGETDVEKRTSLGQGPKLGVGLGRFYPTHSV